jgi:thiamine biosynthesis protein ThiS
MKPETAVIVANGDRKQVKLPCSVADLLSSYGFKSTQAVVEYNGKVLERSCLRDVQLCDGDRLEVIVPVAGG